MLIQAGIILGLCSAFVELYLFCKFNLIRKWVERYPLAGIGFSLALSVLLGHAFGAAGVTVMLAGVSSTVLTMTYYGVIRAMHRPKRTLVKL